MTALSYASRQLGSQAADNSTLGSFEKEIAPNCRGAVVRRLFKPTHQNAVGLQPAASSSPKNIN